MGASGSSRNDVLFIKDKTKFKKSGKGKKPAQAKKSVQGKGKAKVSETSIAKPKPKGASSDVTCFYCNSKGHWKRNCPKYSEDI